MVDEMLARLLANAFSTITLLSVDQSDLFPFLSSSLLTANAYYLFLSYLSQLPQECNDKRVVVCIRSHLVCFSCLLCGNEREPSLFLRVGGSFRSEHVHRDRLPSCPRIPSL